MTTRTRGGVVLVVTLLWVAGCATQRPVLYPNHTLQDVGWDAAQADVDACIDEARAYGAGGPHPAAKTAGSTVVGSAAGAAVGSVVGAVRGRPGRGAAAGAAGGAVGGFLRGVFRSRRVDPIEQRYVNICLSRQGYEILGWK